MISDKGRCVHKKHKSKKNQIKLTKKNNKKQLNNENHNEPKKIDSKSNKNNLKNKNVKSKKNKKNKKEIDWNLWFVNEKDGKKLQFEEEYIYTDKKSSKFHYEHYIVLTPNDL